MQINNFQKEHKNIGNKKRRDLCLSFFQTHKGGYGEGDHFYGVTVPDTRSLLKKYKKYFNLEFADTLLNSKYHEDRYAGVIILIELYKNDKSKIFKYYISQINKGINNWDIIDISAYKIIGDYIYEQINEEERYKFFIKYMYHKNLWFKRVCVLSTFYSIKKHENKDILYLAKNMLKDKNDLIHKALGWMLRESGKRCSELDLIKFVNDNKNIMPKITYRYATERCKKT